MAPENGKVAGTTEDRLSEPPSVVGENDVVLPKTSELSTSDVDSLVVQEEAGAATASVAIKHLQQQPIERTTAKNTSSLDKGETSSPSDSTNSDPTTTATTDASWRMFWECFTEWLHESICRFVVTLAMISARNPKTCITLAIFLSLALVGVGFATNFNIQVEETEIYAPFHTIPREQKVWLDMESGFEESARPVLLILHNDGGNVLGMEPVRRLFQAMDTVRNTTGYRENCEDGVAWNVHTEEFTCRVISPTRSWYDDLALFESQIETEDDLVATLSETEYPGGVTADRAFVLGDFESDDNGTITYVPAYFAYLLLQDKGEATEELEERIIENLFALEAAWEEEGLELQLEFYAERSFGDEFLRAIASDMYLVPVIAVMMAGFACLVFIKCDSVQSRCILGMGSVATIGLSLFSGFGIMFICGVPFTPMTQLLPFVVFGVGLDDTFIITGAFFRLDPRLAAEERVRLTMQEVGSSITVTTITTALAFILGLMSSVPAIYWLCLYAFPTILIDYLYQITLFVAILIIDERRVSDNRRDCCFCYAVPRESSSSSSENEDDSTENATSNATREASKHLADRAMAWYGKMLLRPFPKAMVVVVFSYFFALCVYRTTMLTQAFDVKELLPDGSYATGALVAMDDYQEKTFPFYITFRDVNQSDPLIQEQMLQFMRDISALPVFGEEPAFCWVRDFLEMRETNEEYQALAHLPFQQQVLYAMEKPNVQEAYGDDMVVDEEGNILASRCTILATNTYLDYVDTTIDVLKSQRAVTNKQPINMERDREAFFLYSYLFLIYEFYSIAVNELIWTTVFSVLAVTLVAFVFIPHWTATLFMVPMISVVYIDLMGVLQMAGLHINAVTYVCLVISIGLLVDFLMHVLLRYFESKGRTSEDRVLETLETMGASILLGGLSTFLGVLPLVFSTSTILKTVFTSFCSMVVLGLSHGLILLPVVLSVLGPVPTETETPQEARKPQKKEKPTQEEKTSYFSDSSTAGCANGPKHPDSASSVSSPWSVEHDESVDQFLEQCADEAAIAAFPHDKMAAGKEKDDLLDYYRIIYRSTSDQAAFLLQLRNESLSRSEVSDASSDAISC